MDMDKAPTSSPTSSSFNAVGPINWDWMMEIGDPIERGEWNGVKMKKWKYGRGLGTRNRGWMDGWIE